MSSGVQYLLLNFPILYIPEVAAIRGVTNFLF
jgi:hypothetical protein